MDSVDWAAIAAAAISFSSPGSTNNGRREALSFANPWTTATTAIALVRGPRADRVVRARGQMSTGGAT